MEANRQRLNKIILSNYQENFKASDVSRKSRAFSPENMPNRHFHSVDRDEKSLPVNLKFNRSTVRDLTK